MCKLASAKAPISHRATANRRTCKKYQPLITNSVPTLTWPYVHLPINHFPIVLTTMAFIAAFGALMTGRRGLWLYAMGTMTVAG